MNATNENRFIRDSKFVCYHNTGFGVPNKNECLKFVLVGITPGNNQQLSEDDIVTEKFGTIEYKFKKAFDGKIMRQNLDKMFRHINNNIRRGLLTDLINFYGTDIKNLFSYSKKSIVDFTSLLKNATYKLNKAGEEIMFNTPKQINSRNPELYNREFLNGFKKDYDELYSKRDLIYIACGKQVYNYLIKELKIDTNKVVAIVHPSGTAQGYINSFLEGKGYNPAELYK